MIKVKELSKYCKSMFLDFEIDSENLLLNGSIYKIVDSKETLFNSEFEFLPTGGNYVYEFCGHWYLQNENEEVTMTPLKYIGNPKINIKTTSFLGIHSGNELLNGVGLYSEWIKKAKFLGIKTLAICERNNIGGWMDFQKQCLSNDIKPIVGMSFNINNEYDIKCYAKDFTGWQNLLKFSHKLNVDEELYIKESYLLENLEGLYIIIDPKESKFKNYSHVTNLYQLDTVIFEDEEKDREYLSNLKQFLLSNMEPVQIMDAYYLEGYEYKVREKLWGVGKSYNFRSKNQYFKNNDEYVTELIQLFEKNNNSWLKLYNDAKNNLQIIVDGCNFIYDTTTRHLPKYEMTEEESKICSTNEQLLMYYIKEGFIKNKIKDVDTYMERLQKEIQVLKDGDVIDYFLTSRDIIEYANRENIIVGIGRGSAGGCLVSYLLGIIKVDPIQLRLIFERFLNSGRMGSFEECDAYLIETPDGNIKVNELSILCVERGGKEYNIPVEELKKSDKIIRY